ncbi:MAG: single-stranded-DNA-specific exonuclease RecJ [Clostridia bacterium]|nr:single-stranded-DNA-specific exonuclease RecJ [Clostridia bacterium]
MNIKKWEVNKVNRERAAYIMKKYGVASLPAVLLEGKNFEDDSEILEFLSEAPNFSDPFLIKDMEKAVDRIDRALNDSEKICVYGDYDADGVTSSAVLFSYLESVGADVFYYIPDRETEGYGLNVGAVEKLRSMDTDLIITVDNGISAYKEVELANSLGMDVIVTDHHAVPEKMPNAKAILNPHRSDDGSPYKEFSGVGVVFKLIMALEKDGLSVEELLDLYSDLCALGTIADVVSLTGENRMLVREGLKRLNNDTRPGLAALREKLGLSEKYISSTSVAFNIAPKINACGRLGSANRAVELFLTEDFSHARIRADELMEENDARKELETEILSQAVKRIESDPDIKNRRILIVDGKDWHPGVIGIAAARLKDLYGKPAVVISCSNGVGKGSGRSIEGYALCDAIAYCKDLLTVFGGHPMAAGLSLPEFNIPEFREKMNEYAYMLEEKYFPTLRISCALNPAKLNIDMALSLPCLEPFGTDNPSPLFGLFDVELKRIVPLSGGKHIKIFVSKNSPEIPILFFGVTPEEFPYETGDMINAAVTLGVNEFNGNRELNLYGKDICFSKVDYERLLESKRVCDDYMAGVDLTDQMRSELAVTRDDFAVVYRFLKSHNGFEYLPDVLYYRLSDQNISLGKLMLVLEAMKQLGLVEINSTPVKMNIKMIENPPKVNILSAPILTKLV